MSFTQSFKVKENVNEHSDKTKATPIAMVAPEVKHSADADTEITKNCAVLGCEDSKTFDEQSFFRFPEDANLRQIWTDLTGRSNWTPTDYSYICIQHFSVDCFECDATDTMVLVENAVPSLKLPKHVLEVEYIEEESLDEENYEEYMDTNEYEYEEELESKSIVNGTAPSHLTPQPDAAHPNLSKPKPKEVSNVELLKLFTEVQKMQRQAVGLKDKLKSNMRVHNRQNRFLRRIEDIMERKKKILEKKRMKKSKILLSLQDKINEDMNGLVLAMPVRQTEDLKNFALSIYKYSPQAYIYVRNTLRTMLPSTDVLDSWLSAGFQPKNIHSTAMIKVSAEQTDSELTCKITLAS